MMKISSYMLCDSIVNTPVSANVALSQMISPQIVLRPLFIPGAFSFGISIGVRGTSFLEQNTVQFTIESPDGDILQTSGEISFEKEPVDDQLPEEYCGFVLTTDIRNLEIREPGVYKLKLYVNSEEIGECEIPIYRREDLK